MAGAQKVARGDRAGGAEVDVVGVRGDRQHAVDVAPLVRPVQCLYQEFRQLWIPRLAVADLLDELPAFIHAALRAPADRADHHGHRHTDHAGDHRGHDLPPVRLHTAGVAPAR